MDIRTATGAGLAGLKDAEVLALAARDGRVFITHDHSTMPRHFGDFNRTTPSPGLIVVPQSLPVREVVDAHLTGSLPLEERPRRRRPVRRSVDRASNRPSFSSDRVFAEHTVTCRARLGGLLKFCYLQAA
jgi:hypothetical protein